MKQNDDKCYLCPGTLRASVKVLTSGHKAHHKCYEALRRALSDDTAHKAFEALVRRDGIYKLEERMHKLDSYRKFNRKWPYDAKRKIMDLDKIADFLPGEEPGIEEGLITRDMVERYMATLTPKQYRAIQLRWEGYKPQEMSKMDGREDSGRERWHLHQAKQRLTEFMAEEQQANQAN